MVTITVIIPFIFKEDKTMKQGELKRRITEYLINGMSEIEEKDDQNAGTFVTHLVQAHRIRVIFDALLGVKRRAVRTDDDSVCIEICDRLIHDRYHDACLDRGFSDGKMDIETATDLLNYAFKTLDFNVSLDGRKIIDEYYKVDNHQIYISIPEGATNGEVFKTVFPDMSIMFANNKPIYVGPSETSDESWWDAPYVRRDD
jgi:hypothetical protein